MIATFIVKANITELATNEMSTEDDVIDTLTEILTQETGKYGSGFWLDDVQIGKEG